MLRKVEYTTKKETKTGWCHGFGNVAEQADRSASCGFGWEWIVYTQAIIEQEDGSVIMIDPDQIRFMDNPEKAEE